MLQILPPLCESLHQIAGPDLVEGTLTRRSEVTRLWSRHLAAAGMRPPEILGQLRAATDIEPLEAADLGRELAGRLASWTDAETCSALGRYLAQTPAFFRRQFQLMQLAGLPVPEPSYLDLMAFLPTSVPTLYPGTRLDGLGDLVLGEYRGGGGFAEVYEAHNPHLPGSWPLALKVSFEAEGRRLLGHEAWMNDLIRRRGCRRGVLPVQYTFLNGKVPALAYPAVEGFNLQEMLTVLHRRSRIPDPKSVAQLLLRIARVLNHLHRCLFVHRDIKPSNIMLGHFGGGRREILLIDLGISAPIAGLSPEDEPQGDETRNVIDRILIYSHSPIYASPAQRQHNLSRPCDDIYSLAVIAIHALSGDFGSRVDRRLWQPVLRFRGAPEEFIALLETCVDPRENNRPSNGGELADRLEEVLHDAPWADALAAVGRGR